MPPCPKAASRLFWAILAALLAGCQMSEPSAPEVQRPSIKTDPCAEQLHDVCGALLLYHSTHKRLPATLEQLQALSAAEALHLTCPQSGQPYIYAPHGLQLPGRSGRLVLYDGQPCHSGMRWGIIVGNAENGGPLTTRVVLLPEESVFTQDTQPAPQADD